MKIRSNLHAGADAAKNANCGAQLDALNQQINSARVLAQPVHERKLSLPIRENITTGMLRPKSKSRASRGVITAEYIRRPRRPQRCTHLTGLVAVKLTVAPPTTGGGYVGGVFYADHSGAVCG